MGSRRHIPWSSIDNLGSSYADILQRRVEAVIGCATAIQRWWRWILSTRSTTSIRSTTPPSTWLGPEGVGLLVGRSKRPTTPTALRQRILCSRRRIEMTPVVANEKLDGTNLGKNSQGTLFGRRTVLPKDSVSYLKASLSKVNEANALLVKNAIVEFLKPSSASEEHIEIEEVVLFGELMIAQDKFGYRKREAKKRINSGDWFCFGAKIVLPLSKGTPVAAEAETELTEAETKPELETETSEETAMEDSSKTGSEELILAICDRLRRNGFSVSPGLTIYLNPKLRSLLSSFNIPLVPLVAEAASLQELILKEEAENPTLSLLFSPLNTEGVVVSDSVSGGIAYKWKTAAEDVSSSGILLSKMDDNIRDNRLVEFTMAITPRDLQVLEVLRKVINTPVPKTTKKTGTGAGAPKPSLENDVVLTKEILKAYESALTKYDALETFFSQPNGMKTISISLSKEVLPDVLDYHSALSGLAVADIPGETKSNLTRVVESFVTKTVGRTFGEWKRNQARNERMND